MVVEYHNQTTESTDYVENLINKIFETIDEEKNMQVIFVSADEIREINRTYRNKDYATDVISFPNDEDPESFGDIFINLEKAFEQAAEYGHSYEREVGFLAVHGYLHLKGYDHHTPEEEKEMF